jgi:hypothetical protein
MRNDQGLSIEDANAVYDILVKHADELEDEYSREDFVSAQTREYISEYRFMGGLGFGGKFRRRSDDHWYVDCYSENLNKRTRAIIKATNNALDAYRATR